MPPARDNPSAATFLSHLRPMGALELIDRAFRWYRVVGSALLMPTVILYGLPAFGEAVLGFLQQQSGFESFFEGVLVQMGQVPAPAQDLSERLFARTGILLSNSTWEQILGAWTSLALSVFSSIGGGLVCLYCALEMEAHLHGHTLAPTADRFRALLPRGLPLALVAGAYMLLAGLSTPVAELAPTVGALVGLLLFPLGILSIWALIQLVYLTPVEATLAYEHLGVRAALRRSHHLVRGRWWRTLGIFFLYGLIQSIVQGLAAVIPMAVIQWVTPSVWVAYAGIAVLALLNILFAPLGAILCVLIYLDLRVRKEQLDLHVLLGHSVNPNEEPHPHGA